MRSTTSGLVDVTLRYQTPGFLETAARTYGTDKAPVKQKTFPSAVSSSASWAIGGRKTYLQRCSSLCLAGELGSYPRPLEVRRAN
jgi:hypothetical protein